MNRFDTPEAQASLRKLLGDLGLCTCGSGTTYEILLKVLERGSDHDTHGSYYDPMDDASTAWVEFAAHVLDSWELVEHGTGIGWAWLTEKGELLLAFLRQYGTDDDNWPEWATSGQV